jgi:hypothetical protein
MGRLFMVGLGRPGLIQQRHIGIDKPNLLKEAEFGPWDLENHGTRIHFSSSRFVTNLRYSCEVFQIASETLEEMWATPDLICAKTDGM